MSKPLKFESVEELKEQIDSYFKACDEKVVGFDKEGEPILGEPYLVTGLALALDTSRQTLCNYEKQEGYEAYFDTIKNAKLKCEHYAEKKLYVSNNVTGIIFSLKNNYGWRDKEPDESKDRDITININKLIDAS